jgi:hypothetical protein
MVARCRAAGFDLGGESRYLARRRLAQIATMGATTRADIAALVSFLADDSRQLSQSASDDRSQAR